MYIRFCVTYKAIMYKYAMVQLFCLTNPLFTAMPMMMVRIYQVLICPDAYLNYDCYQVLVNNNVYTKKQQHVSMFVQVIHIAIIVHNLNQYMVKTI